MQYAASYARFYIVARGPYDAVKLKPDVIRAGVELDRDLCGELALILPQPIPPMRTFLAMGGIPAYADWVDVCQRVFPPEEWIIRPGDLDLINSLPRDEKIDEIHRVAIERVKALKPDVPDDVIEVGECSFIFESEMVVEIEKKIRITEPATRENLAAFLWHTGKELPEGFSVQELEEIVAQFPGDVKLLAGFFFWASNINHSIDVAKWADLLKIESWDLNTVLAIAAFLGHIRTPIKELPIVVQDHIHISCAILGVRYSHDGILTLLKSHGIPWLFARNVVLIDPSDWSDDPLTVAFVKEDQSVFNIPLVVSNLHFLLATVGEILLPPSPSELWQFDLLPGYPQPSRLLQFFGLPTISIQRDIPANIIDSLINLLGPHTPISLDWVHFFASIKLDDDRLQRVKDLFAFETRPQSDLVMFPTFFKTGGRITIKSFNGSLDSDVLAFFNTRPPSFTRCFIRSLSCILFPI
jgi:hypothetical protein